MAGSEWKAAISMFHKVLETALSCTASLNISLRSHTWCVRNLNLLFSQFSTSVCGLTIPWPPRQWESLESTSVPPSPFHPSSLHLGGLPKPSLFCFHRHQQKSDFYFLPAQMASRQLRDTLSASLLGLLSTELILWAADKDIVLITPLWWIAMATEQILGPLHGHWVVYLLPSRTLSLIFHQSPILCPTTILMDSMIHSYKMSRRSLHWFFSTPLQSFNGLL